VYALIMVVVRRRWFAATAKHGRAFPLAFAGKLLYLERHL